MITKNDALNVRSHQGLDCRKRIGVAIVELAVALPFLLILIVGAWEISRVVELKHIINAAAREGGRQGSARQLSEAEIENVIRQYLTAWDLPGDRAAVTITNLDDAANGVSQAQRGQRLQIKVIVRYCDAKLVSINPFTDANTEIEGNTIWLSLQEKY